MCGRPRSKLQRALSAGAGTFLALLLGPWSVLSSLYCPPHGLHTVAAPQPTPEPLDSWLDADPHAAQPIPPTSPLIDVAPVITLVGAASRPPAHTGASRYLLAFRSRAPPAAV
jgi:hypothetical protein